MDHRKAAPGVTLLPEVREIQGLRHIPGQSEADGWVTLQYTDHKNAWHQVAMPFPEAMYLANLFRALVQDTGFRLPSTLERPR
jgi:N-formylglutamate amidohydrolase